MNSNEYKQKIMNKLIFDDDIAKALLNKQSDFLHQHYSIPTIPEKLKMGYKNIYPYFLIPKIQDAAESYIISQFKFQFRNIIINKVFIEFRIFVHVDLQQTDENILRLDFITNRMKKIFNENSEFGIGDLYLQLEEDLIPINDKYIVTKLLFSTMDFSR